MTVPAFKYERYAVVRRRDTGVGLGGDDGEVAVSLYGDEGERAGAGQAEAALAADVGLTGFPLTMRPVACNS